MHSVSDGDSPEKSELGQVRQQLFYDTSLYQCIEEPQGSFKQNTNFFAYTYTSETDWLRD